MGNMVRCDAWQDGNHGDMGSMVSREQLSSDPASPGVRADQAAFPALGQVEPREEFGEPSSHTFFSFLLLPGTFCGNSRLSIINCCSSQYFEGVSGVCRGGESRWAGFPNRRSGRLTRAGPEEDTVLSAGLLFLLVSFTLKPFWVSSTCFSY